MKRLKSLFILIALLGGFTLAQANTAVKVYPRIGLVVTTMHKPKIYVHKGVSFHFSNGIWYRAKGKRFVVSTAPVGLYINSLPMGRKVVYVKGRRYYRYNGIWYQKRGRGFSVVKI